MLGKTKQFCSCCSSVEFLNNKNKEILGVDVFSNILGPEIEQEYNIQKKYKMFIKKPHKK